MKPYKKLNKGNSGREVKDLCGLQKNMFLHRDNLHHYLRKICIAFNNLL